MSFIITRTNGIVTQVWEHSDAGLDWLRAHMSKDVHWRNLDGREHPEKWENYYDAAADLKSRQHYLRGPEKANEKNWKYHIIREEEKDELDRRENEKKREADPYG